MIYALGGVSGSGKTFLRQNHPELEDLTCRDIETFYRQAEALGRRLTSKQALQQLELAVGRWLASPLGCSCDLVVEAFFRPDGPQREMLDEVADSYNEEVEYVWCAAPCHECRRRVQADTGDTPQRRSARLNFIRSAPAQLFNPTQGEAAADVFGCTVDVCRECCRVDLMASCPLCSGDNDVCRRCISPPPYRRGPNWKYKLAKQRHAEEVSCDDCHSRLQLQY